MGDAGRSVSTSLPVPASTGPGPAWPVDMPPGALSLRLTRVAVMKKFQGSRVPRPSMKKISQTALYLGMGEEEEPSDPPSPAPPFPDQTQGSPSLLPFSLSSHARAQGICVCVQVHVSPYECKWRGRCPGIGDRAQLCPEEGRGPKPEGHGHRTVVLSPRRLRGPCRLGNQCDPHIWRWFWKSCSTGWGWRVSEKQTAVSPSPACPQLLEVTDAAWPGSMRLPKENSEGTKLPDHSGPRGAGKVPEGSRK